MKNIEITSNLSYRRQFIMAPKEIDQFNHWKMSILLKKYILYVHPDLVQTIISENNKRLIVLGDIYDPFNPDYSNTEIVSRLIKSDSIIDLVNNCISFSGRYAFFYINGNELYFFNDPSSSRKIYYTQNRGVSDFWCGSQPHVIAKLSNSKKDTSDILNKFINSKEYFSHNKAGVFDSTIYEGIRQLTPNHYYDCNKSKVIRFWPNNPLKQISLEEGIRNATSILQGTIKSAFNRNELMIPITSGNDSRLILAASRELSDGIFYYINKHKDLNSDHPDLKIPDKLFRKLGLKFNILEYSDDVDEYFEKIYYDNCESATENDLSLIYNVYYKKFSNKINLPGRLAISRNFFTTYKKNITPELLAKIYNYNDLEFVIDKYREWLDDVLSYSKKYNYKVLALFDWEENNGNYHTLFPSYKDIAQDEFAPMNNRLFIQNNLSVPEKYRNFHTNYFFKALIKEMWPELLSVQINPHKNDFSLLHKLNIYWPLRRLLKKW